MTTVIGIDPSLAATGICWGAASAKTIKTRMDDPYRLRELWSQVDHLVHLQCSDRFGKALPVLAVVEDLPTHAKSAGLTGQAQGIVRLALQQNGVPFITVPPATLKKYATGKGNAGKGEMASAMPPGLPVDGWDDNAVDAWWLRKMGVEYLSTFGEVVDAHFGKKRWVRWATLPKSPKEAA